MQAVLKMGHQQGDGDFKQVLPAVGAVDDGRLVNGGIDIAVPRDEVDHVEGRKLPGHHADDGVQRLGVASQQVHGDILAGD